MTDFLKVRKRNHNLEALWFGADLTNLKLQRITAVPEFMKNCSGGPFLKVSLLFVTIKYNASQNISVCHKAVILSFISDKEK